MNKYNSYKDSGIEWIGKVPEHWKVGKLYQYGELLSGSTPSRTEPTFWDDGNIPWMNSGEINKRIIREVENKITELGHKNSNTPLLPIRTVMMGLNGQGKTKGTVGILEMETTCNQSLCGIIFNDKNNPYFQYYYLDSQYYHLRGMVGEGQREGISVSFLKRYPTIVPPTSEQHQIVQYLDNKTTLIDTLIQKTQEKITLLREKRTSLINHTVTKGLNPDVEMKDSGVDWIGKIPKHWKIKRVGYISKLLTGNPWKSELFDFDEGIKIVRGENVSEGFLRWGDRTRYWKEDVDKDSIFYLKDGDIVISMDGSKVGKNYVQIKETELPLLLHQRMCRVRVNETYDSRYVLYFIGSDIFKYYIDISKTDPMIPHITQKNIYDFKISIPSLSEQHQIIEYLDEQTKLIDTLIQKEEKRVELLKEYRQTLISDMVTGKIKVCN